MVLTPGHLAWFAGTQARLSPRSWVLEEPVLQVWVRLGVLGLQLVQLLADLAHDGGVLCSFKGKKGYSPDE